MMLFGKKLKFYSKVISANGFDITIIKGLISLETQKRYVKQGKSKTLKSKHLEGRAIDVSLYPVELVNKYLKPLFILKY